MKKLLRSMFLGLVLCVGVLALTACGGAKSDSIVGSWKYDGADYTYTFNEDGTGNYNSAGTDMPFKYEISGKNISFFYDGDDISFDTEFEINGNVLNVKDSNNEDVFYNKRSS